MFLSGLVVGRVRYKCMQSVRQFSSNLTVEKSSSKAGKRYASPMITLHQLGGKKITVVTLDEATRLSKRRSLRLVKTASASGNMERDEYRLFTEKDFLKFKGDEDISVEAEVSIFKILRPFFRFIIRLIKNKNQKCFFKFLEKIPKIYILVRWVNIVPILYLKKMFI